MILNKILLTFLLGLAAGQVHSQTNTNWGAAVAGIQMSISLTNTLLTPGSNVVVKLQIRNSSTNEVSYIRTGFAFFDFNVSLIEGSGALRTLTPPWGSPQRGEGISGRGVTVFPGIDCPVEINFKLDKDIKPGKCKLRVSQQFIIHVDGKYVRAPGEVVSNPAEVEVKAGVTQTNAPASTATNAPK